MSYLCMHYYYVPLTNYYTTIALITCKGAEKFDSILNDSVVELTSKNPSIAGPVFTIQVNIRQALINGKFWIDLANLRNAGVIIKQFATCTSFSFFFPFSFFPFFVHSILRLICLSPSTHLCTCMSTYEHVYISSDVFTYLFAHLHIYSCMCILRPEACHQRLSQITTSAH